MTKDDTATTSRNWWAEAAAVGGLLIALLLTGMFVQSLRISASPARTTGALYEKYLNEGDSENPTTYYRFRYSFRDASGREYRGRASVIASIYDGTKVGDPLEIEYQTDDPGNNRVRSETGHPQAVSLVICWFAAVGAFVYFGPRRWFGW